MLCEAGEGVICQSLQMHPGLGTDGGGLMKRMVTTCSRGQDGMGSSFHEAEGVGFREWLKEKHRETGNGM